ncbi:MAG: DUF4355 domain-containing protein [Microcella pacifica]
MSEQTGSTTATEETTTEQGQEEAKEFQAITSQEDFDKAIQARIARERAKIPKDYDELKAKAERLAQIEESQKTEAEKQAERLAEIERENAELKTAKLRAEVAAGKGVPADLLSGSTQEELEAAADKILAWRGEQSSSSGVADKEGRSPSGKSTGPAEDFAAFITQQLG